MSGALPRVLGPRWVHQLLGGALLMPYFLLTVVAIGVVHPDANALTSLGWQFLGYLLSLPLVAATGLFPLVRSLESDAARALSVVPAGPDVDGREHAELATGPARSWAARRRAAVWFTAHVGVGALVSGITLALPPFAVVLAVLPFSAELRRSRFGGGLGPLTDLPWLGPLAGLATLALVVAAAAAGGALLARLSPALLGPTPADRLAAAEERAADLAARNRLARELHDSVGHALSAVSLQATAARTVLDTDPAFAREALAAIEETARGAVGELDTVLGLLREEDPGTGGAGTAPAPTLADLAALLDRTRAAGLAVELPEDGRPPRALPALVSREAYRIVQEGLSNALRHAGPVPLTLRFATHRSPHESELVITMRNPLRNPGSAATGPRAGGGRGLRGIAERATLLGGGAEWDAEDGAWRLVVRLPLGADR
ncbi:histidine kinase [Streptomyces sp. B6B3]|uniref:sensor histidine kinase n=1 Tax=Streptomyces sp. B6B3 TaxID=3153570 RepID=UPI00325F4B4E